jgi:hypothetical protein
MVDITINETIDVVDITVNPNIIEVNVTRTSGGGGGSQTLAQTLDNGNQTGGENIVINDADSIQLENTSLLKKGTYNFGGNGGISRICSNQYEDMWQNGFRHVFDQSGFIRNSSNGFDLVPDSSFDVTLRFKVGSFWTLDNGTTYICTDATEGAAVWEIYSVAGIPTLQQVLTEDNQTGGIPIYSNDETTYLLVDNDGNIVLSSNFGGLKQIIISEDTFEFQSNLRYTFSGKGIIINTADDGFGLPRLTTTLMNDIPFPTEGMIVWNTTESSIYQFNGTIWEALSGGVPYTGATQDLDLGEFGLLTGNIEFDTTPTNIPTGAGSLVWNDTDGTLDLKLKGGNVTLQVGQENVLRVVNKTATNINLLEANYQAVRVTGAQGQRLKVDLAQATTDALSAETIGLVTETINNNQEGFITTSGLIRNVNTTGSLQSETWADGDILYLSSTTAGRVTKVKPTAPNHLIIIGYVVSAHATQGSIFVKVDNGYELNELHNCSITSETNNQALVYETSTDLWKNKTIIEDSITNGVTTVAPSQNAVFDALALKQDDLETFNRTQGIYFFEEFMGSQAGSVATSFGGLITSVSGVSASCITTSSISNKTNQQGVVRASTGTTLSGFAGFALGSSSLFIGQGAISLETYVTIETLSNATERFFTFFGYAVPSNWQNTTNGIFFSYDEGGAVNFASGAASPNFKCYTKLANVTTLTTTLIPIVASQWYKLRIEINNAGNSVGFYIDGVLVATHTTNIPATTTGMSVVNIINKTVGTTARTMQTDYFMYEEIFTTAR